MALSDAQAQTQINQMKGFILKEAEEKRDELLAKANEECALERQKIVLQEKKKIQADYERKEKQAAVQKRTTFSREYNNARLHVLKSQDEVTQSLVEKSRASLAKVANDPANRKAYRALLKDLVVQSLLTMRETGEVKVTCRAADRELMSRELLDEAAKEYKAKSAGGVGVAGIELEDAASLPAGGCGGVVLSALAGRVVCTNTLEVRLQLATEKRLPDVRKMLFPVPLRKTPLATSFAF